MLCSSAYFKNLIILYFAVIIDIMQILDTRHQGKQQEKKNVSKSSKREAEERRRW